MGTVPRLQRTRPKRRVAFLLLLLPLLGAATYPVANQHLRAASLLLRIENANDSSSIARFHTFAISESASTLATPNGMVRTRTYTPIGVLNPPGIAVLHGVHHLGVDEPRLMAFSRALCQSGFLVFTPELPEIADYHVNAHTLDVIGASVQYFARQTGHKVGLLGLSFAGGESLLVAADPRYSGSLAYVVSIGAHEDMQRVAKFFITGQIARPDGTIASLKPHEYGALVLMYSDVGDFFPAAELPKAKDALRLLLWENVDASRNVAAGLSVDSQAKMARLYQHDSSAIHAELSDAIVSHAKEMDAVSPRGHLGNLHVPVLLLHGAGDDVIPATEMLWLQKDVPPEYLRGALVTPLLSHVSIAEEPPLREKWALVNFMAELLQLGDASRSQDLSKN